MIVTCPRHFEYETKEEIARILEDFGDESPKIIPSGLSGIITVETNLNSLDIPHKIREKIKEEPWSIRYMLRVIPIQRWISSDIDEIINNSQKLAEIIRKDERYRITIEKRNSNLSSKEIISKIADIINRKVSLENPSWIILIEIIGGKTGLSVLKNNDILSVEKEKRMLSE